MTVTEQQESLFSEFKALNPNSTETFIPTLANLQRWHWHVTEAKFRPQYEKILPGEIGDADRRFVNARRFGTFNQMPKYMRERFTELAALFMGRDVWATGSRVDGTWIEKDSPMEVVRLRESMGKSPKIESDYDICLELKEVEDRDELRKRLPEWADLLQHGVRPENKILIPMWDFDKLPESEHANAAQLFEAGSWGTLMALHNKYKLSPQTLCCDDKPVREWFGWAIKNKIIKK